MPSTHIASEKAKKGQSCSDQELTDAATFLGVATTDQGKIRDRHSLVADIGRALGTTQRIDY